MSTNVCYPSNSTGSCISHRIVVMDDEKLMREIIEEQLRKEIDGDITLTNSQDEVVKIAQEDKCMGFILDIDMGEGRKQEGFKTLKHIRKIDKETPVFILSARNKEEYESKLSKYNANFKSKDDIKSSISEIAQDLSNQAKSKLDTQILEHEKRINEYKAKLTECEEQVELCKKERQRIEGVTKSNSLIEDKVKSKSINTIENGKDINFDAYEILKLDPHWLQKFENKYVAFIDGEQASKAFDNQDSIIQWIKQSINPRKKVFITEVIVEDEEIIDLPSSLLFDEMISS